MDKDPKIFVTRKGKIVSVSIKVLCTLFLHARAWVIIVQLLRVSKKGDAQETNPLHREARSSLEKVST